MRLVINYKVFFYSKLSYGKPFLAKAIRVLNLGPAAFSVGEFQILNDELKRPIGEFSKEMVKFSLGSFSSC